MTTRPSLLLPLVLLCAVALGGAGAEDARGQTLTDILRYAQQLPATGGPTAGMAGAGRGAGVADYTTLFGNPAGLGWVSSSMLGGDFAVHNTGSDARLRTPDAGGAADRDVTSYRLGTLGGAYAFPTTRGSLVLGVSFHQSNTYERGFDVAAPNRTNSITGTFLPASFEVDGEDLIFDNVDSRIAFEAGAIDFSRDRFDNQNPPFFFQAANPRLPATDGQMVLEQRDDVLESGQLNEISVGGAVAVAPSVMLGGGLNIAFGSYTFERFFRETETSGLQPPDDPQSPQPPYDPYFLAGTALEGFDELQVEERIDADLSGVNLRFGLSAEPVDALRVGLHLETPTWLNVTEVFGTRMRTFFDCDFSGGSCVRPANPLASGDLDANEFSYDLRTPWRFGVGAQYTTAGLTVAGGVEYIDWTQAEISADDANFSALNREIQRLDATTNARLGAEYAVGALAVRAGVAVRPSPQDRSFEDIDGASTDGDPLFLSGGLSYDVSGQTTVHLNWLQERFDDQFVSYGAASGASPVVRESVARNRVTLGITYRP